MLSCMYKAQSVLGLALISLQQALAAIIVKATDI